LPDINNVEKSFNDLKGEKGTIVVFLSAQCPVVKGYNERLNAVVADYKAKGVNFIGINSNATESLDWVKTHATENYKFPMLIDKGNVIADKFNANITPEMYFFDKDGKLVYHGSIDNDKSGMNIKSTYLRDALDQYLDGKEIKMTTTKAFGCTIKRKGN
jgi:peroxiredoxin